MQRKIGTHKLKYIEAMGESEATSTIFIKGFFCWKI